MIRLVNLCMLIAAATAKHISDRPSSIINGELTTIEDFPFYVFLGYGDAPEDRYLQCGGALIRPNIILTAAHCVGYTYGLKFYVGITSVEDLLTATPYEAEKILPHPKFDWLGSQHDVALVKLKENVTLDHVKVDTINIAHNNPPVGVKATVVGFGIAECTDSRRCMSPSSKHLRTAVVKVIKISGDDVIYTRGENQTSCNGDSGGPLIYDGEVIGVLSTVETIECKGYNTMGPIPFNYYWIKKHMTCL